MCPSFNNSFLLTIHTNDINTYLNEDMIVAVVIAILISNCKLTLQKIVCDFKVI